MKSKIRALAALLVLVVFCTFPAVAGNQVVQTFLLFNGSNAADSTERASIWIPIQGATRIYIRTWSAGATADTDFCDTITTWKTLFSDSVLFVARDSAGTIVTSRTQPSFSPSTYGLPYPMCADSIMITNRGADSTKMVIVPNVVEGVAKPVRGTSSASGYWTLIEPAPFATSGVNFPIQANGAALSPTERFMTQYMRIRITPRTRLTTAGFSSTAGIRTRGINRLKMVAHVVYENK